MGIFKKKSFKGSGGGFKKEKTRAGVGYQNENYVRLYFDEGTAEKLAEMDRPALTLLENGFKKKDVDPDYVLLWPKENSEGGSKKANFSRFKKKAKPVQEELDEEEETEEDDDEESEDDTDEDSDYEEED